MSVAEWSGDPFADHRGPAITVPAVPLISEDLDEILEHSDRILVMSEGEIVGIAGVSGNSQHMAGHH